jgi:aminopeptidase N
MRAMVAVFLFVFAAPVVSLAQKVDVYSRPRAVERSSDYDVLHYRIKLSFDEEAKAFRGETRITLRPLRDGFAVCVLDAETFTVSRVESVTGDALPFEQKAGKLVVRLGREYGYHQELSFTVFYAAENVSVDSPKFGMAANYELGLSFQPENEAHPQLIQTLSFPEGARHWFPCFDHPRDKATSEVIATVRSEYNVISNGELVGVSEDRERGQKTFHWHEKRPHPTYLYVMMAGPYVKLDDSYGSLPLGYWVYPKAKDDAMRSFVRTPEIIEFFEREYGVKYPWKKYDQITVPGIGGGAEATNATILGESTIHDEKADKDFPSHWLVAHEAAHQWWGDLITTRDWTHTWMNEAFATYGEYRYSTYSKGADEGALNLLDKKNTYLREASTRYIRPIVFDRWRYPNQNFDRHAYQKGAAVLNMLRWVMGDGEFRRAVAHFLTKHAYQPVDTHDFEIAIRESTGQVLDWFFEQWVYQAGHPVFEVGYEWLPAEKKVRLKVVQTQAETEWVPTFETPVLIGITTAAGRRVERAQIREREEVFEFDCEQQPLLVRFDEGNYLVKEWTFPKSDEELLFQLANDDVIGRMWAASELGGRERTESIEAALRKSAQKDEFWAVRQAAVNAVVARPAAAQREFLLTRLGDKHQQVRTAALAALGEGGHCERPEFFAEQFEKEDSYVAQAEALRSLGRCDAVGSVPLLRRAAEMDSPREIIRRAAEWALQEVR